MIKFKFQIYLIYLIVISVITITTVKCQQMAFSQHGCENLSSELCVAAYPQCVPLILRSCCPGQADLCLDVDTVIGYLTNKEISIQGCLKHVQTGNIYELWGDMDELPSYDIFPVPNITCEDLRCEHKGFECILNPVTFCETRSKCCVHEPRCHNFERLVYEKEDLDGNANCELVCPTGFICRAINDVKDCLPINCSYIECPPSTECLPLIGLDVVSCFRSIDVSPNNDITCDNVICPDEFVCAKGVYSNADCVPENFKILGNTFSCALCPKGWVCRFFGWNGFCIEWHDGDINDNHRHEIPCFNGVCLSNQICNTTSLQCEFESCDVSICHDSLECYQNHPSQPRFCVSEFVIPFIQLPSSLPPFIDRFG